MSATATQTKVTERPILFSGPMVKAILEGRKTQTRRAVKGSFERFEEGWSLNGAVPRALREDFSVYGEIGDRLWVRETWRTEELDAEHDAVDGIRFRADAGFVPIADTQQASEDWVVANNNRTETVWRPPIFMPRWASRITLEVTKVRVERLQEISEADAIAEGFNPYVCAGVFEKAAGKIKQSNCYWLEHEETGEEDSGDNCNYCRDCALKRQKRRGKKWVLCGDGGSAMESDGPAYCACGTPLLMSLTEYGIDRELRIEDDPEGTEPQYFPVSGMDASIAAMFAGGIGDLQERHYGRLAQTGFATGWNALNAKRGYSWESNPWVWVIEFKKL